MDRWKGRGEGKMMVTDEEKSPMGHMSRVVVCSGVNDPRPSSPTLENKANPRGNYYEMDS
jgi:hypothetical protein